MIVSELNIGVFEHRNTFRWWTAHIPGRFLAIKNKMVSSNGANDLFDLWLKSHQMQVGWYQIQEPSKEQDSISINFDPVNVKVQRY